MKKLALRAWMYWENFKRRDKGQGMVEYALIIALVVVIIIAAFALLKGPIEGAFGNVANNINAAA